MKMEFITKKENMSDEDEDLESLRMAALQTIKKAAPNTCMQKVTNLVAPYKAMFNASPQGKRGRGYQGGRQRNGQFNHRGRNTNLIAISTVPNDDKEDKLKTPFSSSETVPKLIRPQDRYCNNTTETKSVEVTSKFTRYNNSDNSDTDSEDEVSTESPKKLERSNSLEALMQELENEIQGESKVKVSEKKVKVKKQKQLVKTDLGNENVVEQNDNNVVKQKENVVEQKENVASDLTNNEIVHTVPVKEKVQIKPFLRTKINHKNKSLQWKNVHKPVIHPVQPNVVYQPPFPHQPAPYQTFIDQQMQYNLPYQPVVPVSNPLLPKVPHHPPRYDLPRPLSPLSLNAEVLSTVTMAPLSPRSAAFVLQNREIIERRKRSPRRSYSRSPSPFSSKSSSSRGSRSPLLCRSPPKRLSPVQDPSLKSHRKDPSRNRPHNHNLQSGNKSDLPKYSEEKKTKRAKRSDSLSLSPSPVRSEPKKGEDKNDDDLKEKEKTVDPVLEARRRKFESNEIGKTEGVIRLKPKNEDAMEEVALTNDFASTDDLDDILKDDESVIDLKVDDLFSDDDESEDENEGRFKVKSQNSTKQNVPVLPFTQLVSGPKRNVEAEPLLKERSRRNRDRRHRDLPERKRQRSRSPIESSKRKVEHKSSSSVSKKSEPGDKSKNHSSRQKMPVTAPIECKKIEIKIRNPAKYNDEVKERRKIEVGKVIEEDEPEPEVIIENEEEVEDGLINKNEGGDLRAQLSRKRAERQSKFPITEAVPSRILQNALQGAVFKKIRKVKKDADAAPKDFYFSVDRVTICTYNATGERKVHVLPKDFHLICQASDGKIPIHLRLGNSDLKISKKVSRKRKNQLEQV